MERIGDADAEGRRLRLSLRGRGWWWVNRWGGGQCPPYWLAVYNNSLNQIRIIIKPDKEWGSARQRLYKILAI
jgi:hypothetical protein